MDVFGDLFNSRQLLALTTFARLIRKVGLKFARKEDGELAKRCIALSFLVRLVSLLTISAFCVSGA